MALVRSLANAMLGKIPGKPDRHDLATRMAADADFRDKGEPSTPAREPFRKVDQIEELRRFSANKEARASSLSDSGFDAGWRVRFWRAETSCAVGSAPSAGDRRDLCRFGRLLCWREDAWRPGQAGARTNIRFRFHAIVTMLHSPRSTARKRARTFVSRRRLRGRVPLARAYVPTAHAIHVPVRRWKRQIWRGLPHSRPARQPSIL